MSTNYLTQIFTDNNSKENLLSGLKFIAESDGEFHKFEKAFIETVARELDFSENLEAIMAKSDIVVKFNSKELERSFIIEALRLTLIDGNMCENEIGAIKTLTDSFGWPESEFNELKQEQESMNWLHRNDEIELM